MDFTHQSHVICKRIMGTKGQGTSAPFVLSFLGTMTKNGLFFLKNFKRKLKSYCVKTIKFQHKIAMYALPIGFVLRFIEFSLIFQEGQSNLFVRLKNSSLCLFQFFKWDGHFLLSCPTFSKGRR